MSQDQKEPKDRTKNFKTWRTLAYVNKFKLMKQPEKAYYSQAETQAARYILSPSVTMDMVPGNYY